jgi:osmoprotectant transport system substrate-binding protein
MRKNWKGAAAVFAAVAVMALLLAGCAGNSGSSTGGSSTSGGSSTGAAEKGPIRVGSKIDVEGPVLGQIILGALEANGFKVEDKTRTGATDVVRKALLAKQIDMYPEYTANALTVFFADQKIDPAILKDATKTYEEAARLDKEANNVIWLKPAPANNTWAVAVPKKFADDNKIASLADLAAYINKGGKFKIVGSQEFFDRSDAFPAFAKAYGFKVTPDMKVALATGDTAVTEKAAAEGAQGANAAMAYGTDGTIAALDLVVLSDPKGVQPIYQPAPTVNGDVYDKYPEMATILDPIFAKLDLTTLQDLNKQVAVDGKSPKAVAAAWLKSQGFVQ